MGRDAFSFARAGYHVMGIDQSELRTNLELVEQNGLAASIGFKRMDTAIAKISVC